jgi:hypothetical protein
VVFDSNNVKSQMERSSQVWADSSQGTNAT